MDFLKGRRAYVHNLGCRVNQSESAMIADALSAAGFEVLKTTDGANLMVVNSCALTEFAEAKTRRSIRDFKKKNPQAFVCATGCYAQTKPEDMAKAGVDFTVSNPDKGALVELLLDEYHKGPCKPASNFFGSNAAGRLKGTGFNLTGELSDRMNLKIQDGCDNACAYCIIPRARGLPVSRNLQDILEDARRLVSRGVREIILTGINMSKFDASIAGLCDELDGINDLKRIGIGSLEPPVPELEQLAQRMADENHKLAKHFHISLQSASNKVLNAMRRKYSVEEFFGAINLIKNIDPLISIGTDVICGFPDETEDDFEETCENIKKSDLSFLHVFTYSPRPKTLAALRKAPALPERKARADRLRKIGKGLHENFLEQMRGKPANVLLEARLKNGSYQGYTENYIPCLVKIPQAGLKNEMARIIVGPPDAMGRAICEFEKLVLPAGFPT